MRSPCRMPAMLARVKKHSLTAKKPTEVGKINQDRRGGRCVLHCALVVFLGLGLTSPSLYAKDKIKKKDPDPGQLQTLIEPTAGYGVEDPVCPKIWGDGNNVVDIISTRVDHAVNLRILIAEPVTVKDENNNDKFIDTRWTVRIEHTAIAGVALVDGSTKSEETVTIKAGEVQSERFFYKGKKVGQTTLRWKRQPDPSDPTKTFLESSGPANVWNLDKIVDYADLGGDNICYDPDASPNLDLDPPTQRTTCGEKANAVAADGESRQLVRLKTGIKGRACFKVVVPNPAPTKPTDFGKFDGANPEETPTDPDSTLQDPYWAFGTYLPPSNFELTAEKSREVEVEIAFTPQNPDGSFMRTNTTVLRKKITISRPPVLLVHGLWSDMDTWAAGYRNPKPQSAWLIERMNYPGTNAASFILNTGNVRDAISKLVKKSRGTQVATTQVDVIAHSMGGLITRNWIASGDNGYLRADNLKKGDVRKLVTLASPHLGSQIANLLINLHQNFPHGYDSPLTAMENALPGDIHRGAVCDLAENSPGLAFDSTSGVKGRAYSASGGPVGSLHSLLSFAVGAFESQDRPTHIDPYVFPVPNDAIVAAESQQYGLPFADDPGLIHFTTPFSYWGLGITVSETTARDVFQALDGAASFSDGLPIVVSTGFGVPRLPNVGRDAYTDSANYATQCAPGGPMRQP